MKLKYRTGTLAVAAVTAIAVILVGGKESLWPAKELTAETAAFGGPARAAPVQVQGQAQAQAEPGVIRYAPNAPQLSSLKIEAVQAAPLPVADPQNGRLAYDENLTARISSPIAGRVLAIPVEVGDRVARNATLLRADSPELASADADWRKAAADDNRKKLAWERARTLFEHEVVPKKDVESAEADYRQAQAETRRAALRMKNLHASGSENGSFSLKTPIAGVVAERRVTPGMELRPDLPAPLFVVTDPSRLWLLVDVPERSIARIHPGQAVSLETDAWPGERYVGKVERVGFALDPDTRRMQVRCSVANPDGRLRPEMFARVFFLADGDRMALPVPNASLVVEGVNTHVFVETEPGVFRKRVVTLAQRGRDASFVDSGLAAGERVVTEGALLLESEAGAHAR